MSPNEFFWDGIFWNLAELVEIWALFEIDVKAIAEADFLLAVEASWMNSEWILDLATTLIETSKHCLSALLAKLHALESLLYFLLLSCDFFERIGFSSLLK